MPSEIPPSLRRSLLARLEPGGRAAEVERRIGEAIELGVLADGEQLPSEAELAAQLGVAPMTLREALVGLRRSGLVATRRGQGGGTFVRGSEELRRERLLARLGALSVDQLRDRRDEHVALAAMAATLAAERALDDDFARLEAHIAALESAAGERALRAVDDRFHIELAVAARALGLSRALTRMAADVGGATWALLGAGHARRAAREHRAILDGLRARDGATAARLVREHLEHEAAEVIAHRIALYLSGDVEAAAASPIRPSRARMAAALRRVERDFEATFEFLAAARDEAVTAMRADARAAEWETTRLEGVQAAMIAALGVPAAVASGMGIALGQEVPVAGPRWIWWRAAAERPVPLPVERDPLHPEYYDYETAAWYARPLASGEPTITGPFIDHGAEDDNIFTLAVPIPGTRPEGGCVGVVGADVAVARLEAIAVPALLETGGDALLLNAGGVIVASSTGAWLPGERWDPDRLERLGGLRERWALAGGDRLLRSDALGWALVVASA